MSGGAARRPAARLCCHARVRRAATIEIFLISAAARWPDYISSQRARDADKRRRASAVARMRGVPSMITMAARTALDANAQLACRPALDGAVKSSPSAFRRRVRHSCREECAAADGRHAYRRHDNRRRSCHVPRFHVDVAECSRQTSKGTGGIARGFIA